MSALKLPKLIATDLDGTLLRSDHSISGRTLATLGRLERAGIVLVLVTGRPLRWLEPVLERTGRRGTVVCANGAAVVDGASGEILVEWPLRPEALADATAAVRDAVPGAAFAVEHRAGMVREPGFPYRDDRVRDDERVAPLDAVLTEPAHKLLVRAPGTDPVWLHETCARALEGCGTATHAGDPDLVEVSAPGITKATGLAWVAARHEIGPADVLAFGDMPNDVPMLDWAGRSAAVAGAHPAAAAAADVITGSNDADGVARYLDVVLDGRFSRS